MKILSIATLGAFALPLTAHAALAAEPTAKPASAPPVTPNDVVAAAPAADWKRIAPSDLMVMDLAPDTAGRARRVVIQLMPPPFSQGWVDNIRKLVAARWYDGTDVIRSQDNYVVQWGDPDGDDKAKARSVPKGLRVVPESGYAIPYDPAMFSRVWYSHGRVDAQSILVPTPPARQGWRGYGDPYADSFAYTGGFPIAAERKRETVWQETAPGAAKVPVIRDQPGAVWPIHCYGMVGVARDLSPNTGDGSSLYVVIGTPPRQLDRNIALVGRVIAGMEWLSTMPRGTGDLGFYKTRAEMTPITSVRMGNEVPGLPAYEYLSTDSASFAAYADKRANRKDDFYIHPAGGVDVCNVPVPIREVGAAMKPVGK